MTEFRSPSAWSKLLSWLRPRHRADAAVSARKLAPISQVVAETGRPHQKNEA